MLNVVGSRLLATLFTALAMSVLVFGILRFIPGDAAILMLGDYYGHEDAEALRARMGLDRPVYEQYASWLMGALRGDFGTSLRSGDPIAPQIVSRLPITLELSFLSLLVSVALGIPAGVIAAQFRGRVVDAGSRLTALLGISIPNFWLGLMLILLFALTLRWLPTGGYAGISEGLGQHFKALILPVLTLGTGLASTTMRITRGAVLEVMHQDYVRTAQAKGLRRARIMMKHALRAALIPIVTILGLQLGSLISGAVVVEVIFSLPGIGLMIVNGVANRDYPLVTAVAVVISVAYTIVNLGVDILYTVIDPRVRYD